MRSFIRIVPIEENAIYTVQVTVTSSPLSTRVKSHRVECVGKGFVKTIYTIADKGEHISF